MPADDSPPGSGPFGTLSRGRLLTVLAVATVVVLLVGAAIGMMITLGRQDSAGTPGAESVDVGFSQDMRAHHLQAITMAGIERDKTTDPELHAIAFDIESTQIAQAGEMDGWLTVWGQPELTDVNRGHMVWMAGSGHAHGTAVNASGGVAVMPGMASTAELNKLRSLSGKELDLFFLQLMLRHHQGALPMAEYAAEHASVGYVRDLAAKMVAGQNHEVQLMFTLLTTRGGTPLPSPN